MKAREPLRLIFSNFSKRLEISRSLGSSDRQGLSFWAFEGFLAPCQQILGSKHGAR